MENKPDVSEITDVSRPECVRMLRELRKTLGIPVNQVINMMKQAEYAFGDTTIRRFFNDDIDAATNWRAGLCEAVSDVLLGTNTKDFDPTKAKAYFEECKDLQLKLSDFGRKIAELENENAVHRSSIKKSEDIVKFLMDEVVFLRKRLEYISPEKETICTRRLSCLAANKKED